MGTIIIAGTGPSLTPAVVETVRASGLSLIVVNDAVYPFIDHAATLVASDGEWWRHHRERLAPFRGERIFPRLDLKDVMPDLTHLTAMVSTESDSFSPFTCGPSSLYAAISLAVVRGWQSVALVGADMRVPDGKQSHFFGDHPPGLRDINAYETFLPAFDQSAQRLPPGVSIVNCTPDSALRCFPFKPLAEVLDES